MSFKGTAQEMPKRCKGCAYRSYLGFSMSICDYAFQTGKLRNCPPEECKYYIKKNRKKNNEEEENEFI